MTRSAVLVPWSLGIFILLYPLRGGDTLGFGFLASAVTLSVMILAFALRPKVKTSLTLTDLFAFSYFVMLLITALLSGASDTSIRYLTQIFALTVTPYVIIRYAGFSVAEAERMLAIVPLLTIIAAINTLVIIGPSQMTGFAGGRLGTETINPVGLGIGFGLGSLMTLSALKMRLCGKIIGSIALAASVTMLILSASRGPMIALALCSPFVLFGRGGRLFEKLLIVSGVGAAAYFAFGLLDNVMVLDRFVNAAQSASANARLNSWHEALDMFNESPLVGHGLGTFEDRHGEYVHNTLLEHLANGGLMLALPFLAVIMALIYRFGVALFQRSGEVVAVLALCGVFSVLVRMLSLSMANTKDIFLFLAMAVSCAQALRRRPVAPPPPSEPTLAEGGPPFATGANNSRGRLAGPIHENPYETGFASLRPFHAPDL